MRRILLTFGHSRMKIYYQCKLAELKSCRKVLKHEGGSNKGFHVHQSSAYQIDLLKRPNNEGIDVGESRKPISTRSLENWTTILTMLAHRLYSQD